jgi:hypothetical protein
MWIAVLLAVAVIGGVIFFRKPGKKQAEEAVLTFKIEATPSAPKRERTIAEEEVYQQAKKRDWDSRSENGARWSGDVTSALPIRALTINQYYCLRDATMRFKIRCESDFVEDVGTVKSIKYHAKKTINALVKHGMIAANGSGEFEITDLGCRAFETLPTRYS